MREGEKLTDKQQRFCDEYLVDFNGTQAAIRAGYSKNTANEQAARLLANVSIQGQIKSKQNKVANKLEITVERVLQEYARIAFSDITTLYAEDGSFKKFQDMTADERAVLSSLEVEEDKEGIGFTRKVKVWDKKGALDSICKVLGYNAAIKQDLKVENKGVSGFLLEE